MAGSAAYLAAGGGSHSHEALHRFGLALMSVVPRGVEVWLVGRGHTYFVPEQLRLFDGSRTPTGVIASLQLRAPVTAEH